MTGILFEDIFDVKDIDPDGKKFDRGKTRVIEAVLWWVVVCVARWKEHMLSRGGGGSQVGPPSTPYTTVTWPKDASLALVWPRYGTWLPQRGLSYIMV